MTRFRVTAPDDKENALMIQGAISKNSNKDVAGILFQNFDADTNTTYDIASIGSRDPFGDASSNGYGDLVFKTNASGSNTLTEQVRIRYDGRVGIGTKTPQEALDVVGNVRVAGNIVPSEDVTYDLGASNQRFRDLYLSGNTIILGQTAISADTETGVVKFKDTTTNEFSRFVVKELEIQATEGQTSNVFRLAASTTGAPPSFVQVNAGTNEVIVTEATSIDGLFTSNLNIGIGLSNPTARLHIKNPADYSNNVSLFVENPLITNPFYVMSNGYVGIRKQPEHALDVHGDARISEFLQFPSGVGIDCDSNQGTLQIGGPNVDVMNLGGTALRPITVNIGRAGDTINIAGSLNSVDVTNLAVEDKNITLNRCNVANSAFDAGILLNENDAITGFIKTSSDRNSWLFKAPGKTGIVSFVLEDENFAITRNSFSKWNQVGNSVYLLDPLVGVGTAAPVSKLDVNGNIRGALLTGSRALVSDANKNIVSSTVSTTELGYLVGATSPLQPQINNKQNTITGAASTVTTANLSPSTVVVTNASGKLANSGISITELNHLAGTTDFIQTQLAGKQNVITGAASTVTTGNLTPSVAVTTTNTGKLTSSPVTATELSYLTGTTSSIQTQLNNKQNAITGAASTVTANNLAVSSALVSDAQGKIAASPVTATELGYLAGVTSSIQTQLNQKLNQLTGAVSSVLTSNLAPSTVAVSDSSGKLTYSSVTSAELLQLSGASNNIQAQLNERIRANTPIHGDLLFANNQGIDAASSNDTLRIGRNTKSMFIGSANGGAVITIGSSNDLVIFPGSNATISNTSIEVSDPFITLNQGGLANSGGGAGFKIEEASNVTGYFVVTDDRERYELKAPGSAGVITFSPQADSFTINKASLSKWVASGSNVYVTSSNVGIGTTNPSVALDVVGCIRTDRTQPDRVTITDSNQCIVSSAITVTELSTLAGVTSSIQAQLDSKQATLTGATITVASSNLPSNQVVVSDSNGKISSVAINVAEVSTLAGVTENIQTQLNRKAEPGVVIPNDLLFADGTGIDSISSNGAIHIGRANAKDIYIGSSPFPHNIWIGSPEGTGTITLGQPGDTVIIDGSYTTIHTTVLQVSDRYITLNRDGLFDTASNTGLVIEEQGVLTGHLRTTENREGWVMKAPALPYEVTIQNDLSQNYTINYSRLSKWTDNGTAVYIMDSNVGIGTSNPLTKLHVQGNMRASNICACVHIANDELDTELAPAYTWSNDLDTGLYHAGSNTMAITTGGVEKLRVQENGFVGILTKTPTVALEVNGNTNASNMFCRSVYASGVDTNLVPGYSWSNDPDTGMYHVLNNSIGWTTGGLERMRLSSTGFLGIGLPNPLVPLEVVSGVPITTTDGTVRFFNSGTGNIVQQTTNLASTISIISNSSVWVRNGFSFMASSDQRIKKNIEEAATGTVLDKVLAMKMYKYGYIDDSDIDPNSNCVYGMLAQEVRQVLPEAVELHADVIPSVYCIADGTHYSPESNTVAIQVNKGHGLHVGAKVRLYREYSHEPMMLAVLSVPSSQSFEVQAWAEYNAADKIFVYGHEVNDFHTIDKNKVAMMAIGAIQELHKRQQTAEKTIELLQLEIAAIKSRIGM